MSDERDLIWVPKDKADEFKRAQSETAQLAVIDEIISSTKRSMRVDLEALDDDILLYRGLLLHYKQAYSEALQAHLDASYKIWEDIDAKIPDLKPRAEKTVKDFSIIKDAVKETLDMMKSIEEKMNNINTYQLVKMVELIQAIENADEKTKNILIRVLSEKQEV